MRALQPVIEERVDALLARLREHGKTKKETPLDMMYPYSAMTYGELLFSVLIDKKYTAGDTDDL